jgi:hypothetical protein
MEWKYDALALVPRFSKAFSFIGGIFSGPQPHSMRFASSVLQILCLFSLTLCKKSEAQSDGQRYFRISLPSATQATISLKREFYYRDTSVDGLI